MRRNFFPAFLAVYFFVTASIAAEKWSPHIWSRYSVARSVLEVHIAPPRAGASDYWVGAMTTDDQRIFVEKSKCVQKSDSEIIYEVKGFPTDRAKQYVVLVRARDVNGEFLSSYMSNKTAITIPPFDRAVITVPAPEKSAPTTGESSDDSPGFHVEIWIIIVCVVLFLLLVFIGVMLKVGRCWLLRRVGRPAAEAGQCEAVPLRDLRPPPSPTPAME
ncbi:uncharacterized protein [Littorina saxatilis]|uniref:Uncharacterized protein n=1 Tax=Littorina saxatilis TaxID=31220 RepID=A0AAN9BE64_9CAEN